MTMECAAHEHIQAMLFAVKNDGKWNFNVPPKVDVVGICNVMDDQIPFLPHFERLQRGRRGRARRGHLPRQ